MTDPARELQPASYRGVPFFVETADETRAFARIVHEYPGADWSLEDLGSKAGTWIVKAYLATFAGLEPRVSALRAACAASGPGLLVLPTQSALARCTSFERSHARDRLGYAALSLEFTAEPGDDGLAPPLGLALSEMGQAAQDLGATLPAVVAATLETLHPRAQVSGLDSAHAMLALFTSALSGVSDVDVAAAARTALAPAFAPSADAAVILAALAAATGLLMQSETPDALAVLETLALAA